MLPRLWMVLWIPVAVVASLAFVSDRVEAEEALASWYGPGFSGLPTASGEPYEPYGFTAAHKTMPLGTELLVSYGGSSVEVTVNDRGPYVGARELDLSQGAAEVLGLTEPGVDVVDYSWLGQYDVAPQTTATAQYAETSQYATPEPSTSSLQYASVEQYSPADQSASVDQTSDTTVSTDQYSSGSADVSADQYASIEQNSQGEDVVIADPENVVSTTAAGGPAFEAADSSRGTLLVVRPGETLSELALETGLSVDYLASQNGIADPDVIYAGQVIYY